MAASCFSVTKIVTSQRFTTYFMLSNNSSKSLPDIFKKFATQAFYFAVVPFFFLIFTALYKPFNLDVALNTDKTSFSFNIVIIMCIILLVVVASRMILYFTKAIRHLSMNWYRVWCFGEILVSAFFVTLYVSLICNFGMQYLEMLIICLAYLTLVLVFPYLFLELAFRLTAARSAAYAAAEPDDKMHFYDSNHNLKFVVTSENLLYIKADENYIIVNYKEGEKKKSYELRSSMKRIEDVCAKHGILRCHRSYFINPAHVKAVRKEKENNIVAEIDSSADTLIPVSKKYYEDLVSAL